MEEYVDSISTADAAWAIERLQVDERREVLYTGNPYLGAVVGAALAINTVVAVLIGGTAPLLLRSRGLDPALDSGPILTTVRDMCGFFLTLSMASLLLERLTG